MNLIFLLTPQSSTTKLTTFDHGSTGDYLIGLQIFLGATWHIFLGIWGLNSIVANDREDS